MNIRAVVDRVIDGDTLWLRMRVRLNTSAPELGTPEGDAAFTDLRKALKRGRRVQIVLQTVDQFGRVVGYLRPDNYKD